MDKSKAIERLDAIEREAAELRKLIKRGDSEKDNRNKLYVAEIFGGVYLLAGSTIDKYFRLHSFDGYPAEQGWTFNHGTRQAALDEARRSGTLYAFSDHKEGMAFFAKRYAELN